jgi:hypothetical protein
MNVFTTKWEKSCSYLRSSTSLILPEERESFYIPCLVSCFGALDRGEMLDRSIVLDRNYLRAICPIFSPFSFKGAQFVLAPLPWFRLSCRGIYGLGSVPSPGRRRCLTFLHTMLSSFIGPVSRSSLFNLFYSLCYLVLSSVVMEFDLRRESSPELSGGK